MFSVCSTVGGLSLPSIRSACEMLFGGRNQSDDAPCSLSPAVSAPAMYWVSPWRTAAVSEDSGGWRDGDSDSEVETRGWESQPQSLQGDSAADNTDWDSWSDSEVDMYVGEEECIRDYEGDWEEEGDEEEEEEEWDSSVSTEYLQALRGLFPLLQKGQKANSRGSESELEYLRDGESENSCSVFGLCQEERFSTVSYLLSHELADGGVQGVCGRNDSHSCSHTTCQHVSLQM